jgi:hypothetical protein
VVIVCFALAWLRIPARLSVGTPSLAGMSVIESPPRMSALVADAELVRVLGELDHESICRLSDTELLHSITAKVRQLAQVQGFLDAELAEAEARGVTQVQFGVCTATWFAGTTHSADGRRAGRMVKQALAIKTRFPVLHQAIRDGDVSIEQADAIVAGLQHLPADLDAEAVVRADRQMTNFASTYNPTELRHLGNRLVDVIAPAVAEADAAAYLQRIEAQARRTRSLRFHDDHHGSWRFHGQLPITDGAQLAELLTALAANGDNNRINTPDDTGLGREERCWTAKCADALVEIMHAYQATSAAPAAGGDRPRINVTIDLATLQGQLGHAVLGNGAPISAGEARRLACDAHILPVVLDGPSAPVDVGRDHRLVTGALRLALNARDQGCCYPGCEKPPTRCEAHHLVPWWSGGRTALDNTALLCRHHHQLVEPNPNKPPDQQWELRLDRRGLPHIHPPTWADHTRTPRQHVRYQS